MVLLASVREVDKLKLPRSYDVGEGAHRNNGVGGKGVRLAGVVCDFEI